MIAYYELYPDKTLMYTQYRWRAVATNGKIIADSGESYFNEADCLHGIALMQKSGNAPVRRKAA